MKQRSIVWALAPVVFLAASCTWQGYIPKEKVEVSPTAPRPIQTLMLDVPHKDQLDCGQYDCNHWYRVDVHKAGVLRVDVDADPSGDERITRVLLREPLQKTLAQAVGIHGEPLRIEHSVEPGMYGVLVQGGGARRSYQVTVTLEASDAEPVEGAEPAE
jgi:hypothetical protein